RRCEDSTSGPSSSASATTAPSSSPSLRLERSSPALSSTGTSFISSRSATSPSPRRSFPRRSGWSRPRPRLPGSLPWSLRTPAWPRSRPASAPSIRPSCRISRRSPLATQTRSARACASSSRCRTPSGGRSAPPPAGRSSASGAGPPWPSACSSLSITNLFAVGDEQKVGYEELLATSRVAFEGVPDFTVAVEEEFALLDPATLELVNRFEDVRDAAQGTDLEPHLVGELIASEVEVRTGRCETFAEAAEKIGERRVQLRGLTEALGVGLSSTGTHPWSRWQDQRIIDTPHYRRNDELLRYVVWRNNTFGLHVHVGINGPDRALQVNSALRNYLPELLALSSSSPFVEGVFTHLHSARTEIFTRMFPRCGIPDVVADWAEWESYVRFLYATGSVTEHTQIWW